MTQQTFVVFVAKIIMVQAPLNKFAWESIHKINFANFSFIQKFIRAPITIWKQVQKRAKNGELYPLRRWKINGIVMYCRKAHFYFYRIHLNFYASSLF